MKKYPSALRLIAWILVADSMLIGAVRQPLPAATQAAIRASQSERVAKVAANFRDQRSSLNLDARHDFLLKSAHTDAFGTTHARVEQTFQGVPVWGGQAVLHLDAAGTECEPTDALVRGLELNTTPTLAVPEALAIAHQALAPKGGYAHPPTARLVIYPVISQGIRPGHEAQVNAQDLVPVVERSLLAYHVHLELENHLDAVRHQDYLVDAQTGAILKQWNALQADAAVGIGHSQYVSQVAVNTNRLANGIYEFRDLTRATLPHPLTGELGNTVRDVNHLDADDHVTMGTIYTDEDNVWGDGANYQGGATTSANGQTAAVDGAYGLQAAWDYFRKVHGRLGIDGIGTSTLLRMHISTGWDNAYWSDSCFCMSFGDGMVTTTMTAIDVAAHEMTHGVTSTTASLIYEGESGGLNEANSDIHGTMVKFYAAGGSGGTIGNSDANWIYADQLGPAVARYMYRPDLDGTSANYWHPNLGVLNVHNSSGPMNRAFFFLSQGAAVTGDGSTSVNTPVLGVTQPNFLPTGMTGVGKDVAAAIWYRAVTVYMTPRTNYLAARRACERAATDLFGPDSEALQAVQNAFAGINVGPVAGAPVDLLAPVVTASLVGGMTGPLSLHATATDDSGSVKQVYFFVDNLFVGSGVLADGDYSLVMSASDSLPNGAHVLLAKALDGAGNLGVSAPVPFNTENANMNPLVNGDFEQDWLGWTSVGSFLSSTTVHGGTRALQLGGALPYNQCYQQGIRIPENATSLTISYFVRVETASAAAANTDFLNILLTDTGVGMLCAPLGYHTPQSPLNTWTRVTVTLTPEQLALAKSFSALAVFFNSMRDDVDETNFYVDDMQFQVGVPVADTQAPQVSAPGLSVAGTAYTFTATATDNVAVAQVTFQVDGVAVAATSVAPYAVTLDGSLLGNGAHTLEAVAWDAGGNATTSARLPFTVTIPLAADLQLETEDNNSLDRANGLPVGKRRFQGSLPTLQDVDYFAFTLPPGETLTLDLAGPAGADDDLELLSAAGSFLAGSGGPNCTEHLAYTNRTAITMPVYARVTVAAAPSAMPYFLTPTRLVDVAGPTVTVAFAASSGSTLLFTATASDTGSGVRQVEFYVDGVLRGTFKAAAYAMSFNAASLPEGLHTLTAKAYDQAGNSTTSAAVAFTTASAPIATITAMAAAFRGQTGLQASVPWQVGAAYAWTILGGTITGTDGPSVTFSAGTGATVVLKVTVTSALGLTAQASRIINLKPLSGIPGLTAMVAGSGKALVFKAAASSALTQVEYVLDGTSVGLAAAGADFALAYDGTGLAEGCHVLAAKGVDALGSTGTSNRVTFTLDPVATATILSANFVPRAGGDQVASAVVQPDASYAWSITGGTLTSAANTASISYRVGAGASAVLALEVTSAAGVRVTSSQPIASVAAELDLDGDAAVDPLDMALFVKANGSRLGDPNYSAQADLNGDGIVDAADRAIFVTGLTQ